MTNTEQAPIPPRRVKKADLLAALERVEAAQTAEELDRAEAAYKALADLYTKQFPEMLVSPLGGAVLAGIVAVILAAVSTVSNIVTQRSVSAAQANAADKAHKDEIVRNDLSHLMTLISDPDTKADDPVLCSYYQHGILSEGVPTQRLVNYVLARRFCGVSEIVSNFVPHADPSKDTQRDLRASCSAETVTVVDRCIAADQSGFNSRPKATCQLTLSAPEGHYFEPARYEHPTNSKILLPFRIEEASYRKIFGKRVEDAVVVAKAEGKFPLSMTGKVGCTNDRGTGRTCETTATISAKACPVKCAALFENVTVGGG